MRIEAGAENSRGLFVFRFRVLVGFYYYLGMAVLSYVMGPLLLRLLHIFLVLYKPYSIFERCYFVCIFCRMG